MKCPTVFTLCVCTLLALSGCRSPYHADRGAAFGGVTGAGVGALVGEAAADNPLAGAVIGGVVGAATGTVVGQNLDDIEARNRAQIEAALQRQMVGAATISDVVSMTQSGLGDDVIITYLQRNGVQGTLTANDMIALKQQGVSDRVIQAMQQVPPPVAPVGVGPPPPTVIVREPVYDPWCYGPHWHHHHHHGYRYRPGVSWGFSFHD